MPAAIWSAAQCFSSSTIFIPMSSVFLPAKWLLSGLPYTLFTLLVFTTPDLGPVGKVANAFLTYLGMSVTYSFINIPYCSLGSAISDDPQERVACQSWRFIGVGLATLILTLSLMPMVQWLGDGDKAVGYQRAMMVLTRVGLMLFLLCFSLVKERVQPIRPGNDGFRQDLRDMLKNDQWRRLILVTFVNVLPGFIRMAATLYFITYVMKQSAGFATLFMSAGVVGMIVGSIAAKPLSDHFCKLDIFFWVSLLLSVFSGAMYLIDPARSVAMIGAYVVLNIFHQIVQPINWSIMSDVDDYGEWRSGKRQTGINFSINYLALKMGLAISGASVSAILAWFNYQGGRDTQPVMAVESIHLMFTLLPGALYLLTALYVKTLKVDHRLMLTIHAELNRRRSENPGSPCR